MPPCPGLGESMFVWMSKDPAGPLFSPELLGLADCLGDAGFVIGMFIFNRYLRKWKYRSLLATHWVPSFDLWWSCFFDGWSDSSQCYHLFSTSSLAQGNIFLLGQLLGAFAQMMDLILVLRWNRVIGLPDILWLTGTAEFGTRNTIQVMSQKEPNVHFIEL